MVGAGKMLALLGPSGCGKIWVGSECFADGNRVVPPKRQ